MNKFGWCVCIMLLALVVAQPQLDEVTVQIDDSIRETLSINKWIEEEIKATEELIALYEEKILMVRAEQEAEDDLLLNNDQLDYLLHQQSQLYDSDDYEEASVKLWTLKNKIPVFKYLSWL